MSGILLTPYSGAILGPIAKVLGYLMNGIFILLDKIGLPNIGLTIIIFTIVIYGLLTPLTVKQQKFSKLSAKMNPEIQAIQAKYKDKRDTESSMAMQQETKAVYAKYGVSPSGSCVQLLIQMPILFALYRVIYSIPAYVTEVGNTFRVLAEKIVGQDQGSFIMNASVDDLKSVASAVGQYSKNLELDGNLTNGIIDVLNKVSTADMAALSDHYGLANLQYNAQNILSTFDSAGNMVSKGLIDTYNYFLGLNIANSPQYMFTEGWTDHRFGLCLGAILIPILAALTQWLNVKLMPQAADNNNNSNAASGDTGAAMQQSMKTMNMMMPLMSAVFCFTLPSGMGIYWIAGSVIRTIQQIFINKHIDKMDIDEIIRKNEAKAKKKIEKAGVTAQKMQQYASMNTRSISDRANIGSKASSDSSSDSSSAGTGSYKPAPGSLAAKANMVKEYNERNNK
ncbi:MAG: YidC/Oxa1 family membrane protein insertase [Lachnospiraceae bacterium]|nr:YidC/Oxa1 family membrane protein insertase [Lachnospiraceae bacterium]